jgi:DNA-binding CsgD family transcriptional regulator
MQKTKPDALCEKKQKAQIDTLTITQAEYVELKGKGLRNAEIAHLLGVTLNVFNRYKTKHGIRVQEKEGDA